MRLSVLKYFVACGDFAMYIFCMDACMYYVVHGYDKITYICPALILEQDMNRPLGAIMCLATAVAMWLSSFTAAAGPDALPDASFVKKGRLGNGLSFYLIEEHSSEGLADFILAGRQCSGGAPADMGLLDSLYSFPSGRAAAFLADAGAPIGTSFTAGGDAVCRVMDFPVSEPADADSVLLLLLNVASHSSLPFSDFALIVAGDIDPEALAGRLSLLAMYEPYRPGHSETVSAAPSRYRSVSVEDFGGYAGVTVSYALQRLPDSLRRTVVVPIVGRMNAYAVSVLGRRLEAAADAEGLALLDNSVFTDHCGPDEMFNISVSVPSQDTARALDLIDRLIATSSREGFSQEEYRMADLVFRSGVADVSRGLKEEMTCKAMRDFLYGAPLAAPAQEREYLLARPLPDSSGLKYLNRYLSGMFGTAGKAFPAFDSSSRLIVHDAFAADTALLPVAPAKVSSRPSRRERLTGAATLAFSNGLNVYYRQTPDKDGAIEFSIYYKGGYSQDPALKAGTGAFYSDMMKLDSISGMSYRQFELLLGYFGITLEYDFALNHVRIYGRAPLSSSDILWRALDAVINRRSADERAFEEYLVSQRLLLRYGTGSQERRIADTIDALVHPFSEYSSRKRLDALEDVDYSRVRDFIAGKLGQYGNMVFAFASPLSEDGFRDICRDNAGWYRKERPSRRKAAEGSVGILSGTLTSELPSIDGDRRHYMVFAFPCDYDASGYYRSKVASRLVKTAIDKALAPYGTSARVDVRFGYPPDSHCYIEYVTAFAPDVNMAELVFDIKSALKNMLPVSEDRLERAKSLILNETVSYCADPQSWFSIIRDRYVFNKNVFSHYDEKISGISQEDIGDFIAGLLDGGCVEVYVK